MTHHSALASSHTFHRGACSSVGTKSRLCWKRGKVEEDEEKAEEVRGGVERGMREVEVVDSDVAPVRGLSLSIARESYEGQGQGEEAGETAMDIPSTVRLCIEPSTPLSVSTPSTSSRPERLG